MTALNLKGTSQDFLYKAGVAAIFGPGSSVTRSACDIMQILMEE